MRNLSFKGYKWDKKYIFAVLLTLICSIICGIVLYIFVNINIYFELFADNYVYYVFNFNNGSLIFPHLLSELIFIYLAFLLGYFCKYKYVTLVIFFIRGLYFSVYSAILIGLNSFGGITVAIIVFIPTSICALLGYCFICETCRIINKKYVFCIPAALAVLNTLILLTLVNIIFRVVIVIV